MKYPFKKTDAIAFAPAASYVIDATMYTRGQFRATLMQEHRSIDLIWHYHIFQTKLLTALFK
jgi:hypothetical protein